MQSVRKLITLLLVACLVAVVLPLTVGAKGSSKTQTRSGDPTILNVDDYVADDVVNTNDGWDISGVTLPSGYDRYIINNGTAAKPYLVNAETLYLLTTANVTGTGYVKWAGYIIRDAFSGPAAFTGVIPVSKLSDPIYTSMCLPAEANYSEGNLNEGQSWNSWNNRKNPFNMVQPRPEHTDIINMGAMFMNYDNMPSIDDTFTICIKDFKLLMHSTTQNRDWFVFSTTAVPTTYMVNHFYSIPWRNDAVVTLPNSRISCLSDHTEISLTGADFIDDDPNNDIQEYTFHFWERRTNFSTAGLNAADVDGIVCAYTIWVKEPEMADKFVTTVGADLRPGSTPERYSEYSQTGQTGWKNNANPENGVNQLLASRAYLVKSTPRTVYSHNVYPGIYDSVMDTDAVQSLLGLSRTLNVDEYVADSVVNTSTGWDISTVTLPSGYDRYVINDGTEDKPYLVNTETMRLLANANVIGTGCVKWKGFYAASTRSGPAAYTGVVPVAKLSDPVYMETALPSDANFHEGNVNEGNSWNSWYNRKNGFNLVQPRPEHTSIEATGGIYMNHDNMPAATDTVTFCVSDLKVLAHSTSKNRDWFVLSSTAVPAKSMVNKLYPVPWSNSAVVTINNNQITQYADHTEITLSGSDFFGDNNPVQELYFYIREQQVDFSSANLDPTDVDGIVCTYNIWIKESGMADKFVATVGADLRPGSTPEPYAQYAQTGQTGWKNSTNPYYGSNQLFASRAFVIHSAPRTVFVHNVYPGIYDSVMDTDAVQTLLGIN